MLGKQLRNLTEVENKEILIPGTIISYQDMANPYKEAAIVSRQECKWQRETITIRWFNTSQEESISAFNFQLGFGLIRVAGKEI